MSCQGDTNFYVFVPYAPYSAYCCIVLGLFAPICMVCLFRETDWEKIQSDPPILLRTVDFIGKYSISCQGDTNFYVFVPYAPYSVYCCIVLGLFAPICMVCLFRETKRKKIKVILQDYSEYGRFHWKNINVMSRRHQFLFFHTL